MKISTFLLIVISAILIKAFTLHIESSKIIYEQLRYSEVQTDRALENLTASNPTLTNDYLVSMKELSSQIKKANDFNRKTNAIFGSTFFFLFLLLYNLAVLPIFRWRRHQRRVRRLLERQHATAQSASA